MRTPIQSGSQGATPAFSPEGKAQSTLPKSAGGASTADTKHRVMTMMPLEPRQSGGLKGFGFTVKFDDPEAKASEDNGRTSAAEGAPMTGDASRPVVGRSATATSERTDATAGRDRHPNHSRTTGAAT